MSKKLLFTTLIASAIAAPAGAAVGGYSCGAAVRSRTPFQAFEKDPVTSRLERRSEKPVEKMVERPEWQIRLEKMQTGSIRMDTGHQMFAQITEPAPGKPTLLFLPGVNRGMIQGQDQIAIMALNNGYGVATFHLSTHPHSVATLPTGERPYFLDRQPKLEDFARETEFIAKKLLELGHTDIIPVTLSYSGSFAPLLKGFPLQIDVVPMTKSSTTYAMADQIRRMMEMSTVFNPIGRMMAERMLEKGYRQKWTLQVDNMKGFFTEEAFTARRTDMIEGYTRMSIATHGAGWATTPPPASSRHAMILGTQESPIVLREQLISFREMRKSRPDAMLFLVEEAGHGLFQEQPVAYATLLSLIVANQTGLQTGGLAILTPSKNDYTLMPPDQISKFIDGLIDSLPTESEQVRSEFKDLMNGARDNGTQQMMNMTPAQRTQREAQ